MKRSIIKLSLATLVFSAGSMAMEQGSWQQQDKFVPVAKDKGCSVQVDKDCSTQVEQDCADKVDVDQGLCDKVEKIDIGQSQACSSSQSCSNSQACSVQTTGACFSNVQFGQHSQQAISLWGQMGYKKSACSFQSVGEGYHHHGFKILGDGKANWHRTTWTNLQVTGSTLVGVSAKRSKLDNNLFENGNWTHVDFNKGKILNTTFAGMIFADVDFKDAYLNNVIFANTKFVRHGLKHSSFAHAKLENVSFENVEFAKVNFHDAKLKNVTFRCSDIRMDTWFSGTEIWCAKTGKYQELTGTRLRQLGAHLSECKESSINLSAWLNDLVD